MFSLKSKINHFIFISKFELNILTISKQNVKLQKNTFMNQYFRFSTFPLPLFLQFACLQFLQYICFLQLKSKQLQV